MQWRIRLLKADKGLKISYAQSKDLQIAGKQVLPNDLQVMVGPTEQACFIIWIC